MEMVEYLGENFDAIKSYFPCKTIKDIKHRYYKKLCPKLINFTAEEDCNLIILYSGGILSESSFNQLLVKGILSIKRRLELLLRLRNESLCNVEEIVKFFMFKQDYPNDKNDHLTKGSELPHDEILKFKAPSNNLNSETKSTSNILTSTIETKTDRGKENFSIFYESIRESQDPIQNTFMRDCNFDLNFSDFSSVMNGFNVIDSSKENIFEGFDDSSTNIFHNQEICLENFEEELNALEKEQKIQGQINLLLEKQKCLELILFRIQQLSEGFLKNLEQKIESSLLDNSSKIDCLDCLSLTINHERQLIHKMSMIKSSKNQDEDEMIKELLTKIEILINLINVTKEKVRIIRRLSEA